MLNDWIEQLQLFSQLMIDNLYSALLIIGFFWLCFFINLVMGQRLNYFGIIPRHIRGLIGIPLHPFLHADFNHLFFNSIPLLVLSDFMLTEGLSTFIRISLFVVVIGGFLLWLFGRRAIHIGASNLVMGYLGYLLANAYRHPSVSTIILAIICIYYFGGLLLGLFPQEEKVSWEGHLCGFIAGLSAAFLPAILN